MGTRTATARSPARSFRPPRRGILAVALAVAWIGCGKSEKPKLPPPEVLVAPVVQRNVPIYSEWIGTMDGLVNAEIRPKVEGYLLTQNYQNGDDVKAGQILFQIDPRQFQASLDEARGALGRAEAALGKSQLDVKRYKPLAAQGAVSQQELDDAIQANRANQAAVEQARANVEQARLNLAWTKVASPIDGIAGINQAQIGDLVGPTSVLTTVSTVDPIKVQFPISEQEYLKFAVRINEVAAGEAQRRPPRLEMILANGETYPRPGDINAADRQVDPRTGTILIQALFPNPNNILRPGQYAKLRAATETEKNALLVPQRAVQDLQGMYRVFVVGQDNKVEVRQVKVGPRTHSDWVILDGLKAGDSAVVEGLQKIREGQQVVAKPAPPQDAPGIEPTPAASGAVEAAATPSPTAGSAAKATNAATGS